MPNSANKKEPTEIEKQFAFRIKSLRKLKGWTQEELAFRMDIEVSNLKKYETCRQGLTLNTLKKIADAFEISLPNLLDF
tara:strand:+ start:5698 stop:5934 length:237 start_codon:yes stop_codon:yes gene_type:complete